MSLSHTWLEVDKTAFCENAILLELKNRAQGMMFRADTSGGGGGTHSAKSSLYPYSTQDLLDDLALIAAGPGGKDNVTGACLEVDSVSDDRQILVVRLARNGGIDRNFVETIQNFCDLAISGKSIVR